jgi:topoisomerase-4 subunit A
VELEPTRFPEESEEPETPDVQENEDLDPDAGKSEQQVRDELTGQLRLFDDEES